MKKITYILSAAAMVAALGSCSDESVVLEGEGRVLLTATVNSDVQVYSREMTEQELGEKCKIYISGKQGLLRKYDGIQNLPAEGIKLVGGSYVAEAWTGDSVPASFDKKWYRGYERFEIKGGEVTRVNLSCKIKNVVASVNYDETVDDVLSDYTFTIGNTQGEVTYVGRDDRKSYFMMPSTDTDLTWSISGKKSDGSEYTRTGTIKNVKPAYEYIVHVKYTDKTEDAGGGFFTIEVDESAVEINDEINITLAPEIKGYNFDLSQPVRGEKGTIGRKSIWVVASSELQSVVLDCDKFTTLIPSLGGSDFDILTLSEEVYDIVKAAGINKVYTVNPETGTSMMKINFEELFTDALENDQTYEISVVAVDSEGKRTSAALTFNVSAAPAMPEPVAPEEVYATNARIYGVVSKAGISEVGFDYRPKGSADWVHVDGIVASRSLEVGTRFYAELTDLIPDTEYEYVTTADGVQSVEVQTLATESAQQLPNAGMEDWYKDGKIVMIGAQSDPLFWDSGNHGSSTMNKNVTQSSTAYKHSGTYSALLESQFVGVGAIGKFAAGNLFVGKYLETLGTNGVLGWGRTFTSRPKALRVWVRYEPGTVNYDHEKAPDIVKGQLDKGIIYIALMDDATESYDDNKFAVIVNTKTPSLFEKDGRHKDHVIAYGEHVFDSATGGDGMVEITIPLDYRSNRKPSNIVLVASASKGGDYFAGGPSKMYVDDFELVY